MSVNSQAIFNKIIPFLETYKGRDRVLRLLCYSSKFIAGILKSPQLASQFDNLSSQLSSARACFRLLDDIPTVAGVLSKTTGEKESLVTQIVSKFESLIDIIFCPLDHISWAIDHKILLSTNSTWDTASTLCWVISLYITIYKTIVILHSLSIQKLEVEEKTKEKELIRNLSAKQWYLEMTALKCIADLLFAVNYLPNGMLWSKSFSKWQVGALGTFSSIVSLYQALIL